MVENTNLTMNSQKAYVTIRRLVADNVSPPVVTNASADQIANQLLSNGRRVEHRGHPLSAIKQSLQVTTSHQLSLLSRSAWTNSQLDSAC